jgi:hypothetical protein
MADNFFSESFETQIMDSLRKNTAIIDIDLKENRFTHACLSKIGKMTRRNIIAIEK